LRFNSELTRILQHIFLCVATAIILLHSFIPHLHHGQMNAVQRERECTSENIVDFLRSVFHNDFGDDHHFENMEVSDADFGIVNLFFDATGPDPVCFDHFDHHSDSQAIYTPAFFPEAAAHRYVPPRGPYPEARRILSLCAFSNIGLRGPPVV